MDSISPEGLAALAAGLAPVPLAAFYVFRRQLPRLDGAFYLTLWGLFIAVVEHAGFGRNEFGRSGLGTHDGFHFQMLAAYGIAAFVVTALVVAPLIRRGDRLGWYGLLMLFSIGVAAEVMTARVTTPHGFSSRWWSVGMLLWAYPVAWVSALVLSARPIFRPDAQVGDS